MEQAELAPAWLCIWARVRAEEAVCPVCGMMSGRVHSRYGRRLADVAIGGRRVMIRLTVRRFFCVNPGCARTTFAEQADGTGLTLTISIADSAASPLRHSVRISGFTPTAVGIGSGTGDSSIPLDPADFYVSVSYFSYTTSG